MSMSPSACFLLASALFAATCASAGCSSDPGASSSSGDSAVPNGATPRLSTKDCTSRCEAKSSECGAPSDSAAERCAQVCAESRTEDQLACLEAKSCSKLAAAEDLDALCPAKSTPTPTPTSSGTTSSGGPTLPTELTIKGRFGDVKAHHTKSDQTIVSVLSVAPEPSFSPEQPVTLPDLSSKDVTTTIASPELGSCKPTFSYVLNSSQIGVMIEGSETLPDTDCAAFTDAVARDGLRATLKNVPYPNGTSRATVKIALSP